MEFNVHNWDVKEDRGTYLVHCKNKRNLLYDGLHLTFSSFGKIKCISDNGNRNVYIRFAEKESALKCFYELHKHPDFLIDLPHKFILEQYDNVQMDNAEQLEANIGFQKNRYTANKHQDKSVKTIHYRRRKRRIIQSQTFQQFLIAVSACNQYIRIREDRESLMSELKFRICGTRLEFRTGFKEEIEDGSEKNVIPQLILAKDLYYFKDVTFADAVDVLVSNLPPWYQEVDVYKLLFSLIPDEFLGMDWYRTYAAGTEECSFPYAIVFVKNRHAACSLRYCSNGVVINNRKISIILMEDVESMLLELKNDLNQ